MARLTLHLAIEPRLRRRTGEPLTHREMTQWSEREVKLIDRACRKIGMSRAGFAAELAVKGAEAVLGLAVKHERAKPSVVRRRRAQARRPHTS